MTENQEKELFTTLATLVTGVNKIQTDVKEIKETLNEHSQILNVHSQILNEHSQILSRLDAKTDTIAEKVMNHEVRLTKTEKDIEELQGRVH
jgi:archaellum component FlaC